MDSLMTTTVTVVTRTGRVDEQGEPVRNQRGNQLVDEQSTQVPGCEVQPSGGSEQTAFRNQVSDELTLYGPADFPGAARDAVIVNGVTYEVSSPVKHWADPHLGHVELTLTRTTG